MSGFVRKQYGEGRASIDRIWSMVDGERPGEIQME
jgi:hypothetical protein